MPTASLVDCALTTRCDPMDHSVLKAIGLFSSTSTASMPALRLQPLVDQKSQPSPWTRKALPWVQQAPSAPLPSQTRKTQTMRGTPRPWPSS